MPRFKNHVALSITLFLVLCGFGIWSLSELFNNFVSPFTWLYVIVLIASFMVLSFMIRWAEKDIQEKRERADYP